MVDEKVLEEIQLHEDVINKDGKSPLHQIREKEIGIAGRVLAAKQKAESIIADARRKAVEQVNQAQIDGDALAKEHEAKTIASAEVQATEIRGGNATEVSAIEAQVGKRIPSGVDAVVRTVIEV